MSQKDENEIIADRIEDEDVAELMQSSYINYAMNVIIARALPDVRDGLKPVHRRVLYTMHTLGLRANGGPKKSARIVGEALGKYHPHGDSSVYEAMVRMSQDFSLRYPLVHGQGNFGSIDGDPPAAMRYCLTEDTLINTDKGLVYVKDIVKDSELNSETDIELKVESFGGKHNNAVKFFNSGEHDTIELKTQFGFTVKGSYNHPVMVITKDGEGRPKFVWKTLDIIEENDLIVINRNNNQLTNKNDLISENEAKLLGAMVSEGYISNQQRYYRVGFNNSNIDFTNEVIELLKENSHNLHVSESTKTLENGTVMKECSIDNKDFYQTFQDRYNFSFGSENKVVPTVVLNSSKNIQKIFLQYLFEGDGSVNRYQEKQMAISYSSSSYRLIKEVQTMLLQFGIVGAIHPDRDRYRLIISGKKNINNFIEEVGFAYEEKQNRLLSLYETIKNVKGSLSRTDYIPFISEYIRGKYSNEWLVKNNFDRKDRFDKNKEKLKTLISEEDFNYIEYLFNLEYIYLPVKSIKKSSKEVVYSIKVDSNCHSFTANGIINHNTEAKLSPISEEMLRDLNKGTVDFIENFDGSEKEPVLLPARFPNLLVNGSSGIAVGMATNIPPHNLDEIIDAVVKLMKKPDTKDEDLLDIVQGPDFPTGGIIVGKDGIKDAYLTGRGKITIRSTVTVEEGDNGKPEIVIHDVPYGVSKPNLLEKMAELIRDGKIVEISDIRDESDQDGIRVVIELKRGANPAKLVQDLYKKTQLQTTFGVINLALVDGIPEVLTLKEILENYIKYQRTVITRRTEFELQKAQHRAHILEGYVIVGENIDAVVQLIRSSRNPNSAKNKLMKEFKLSEVQAEAVLDLRLHRITGLEVNKTKKELREVYKTITGFEKILSSQEELDKVIIDEINEIKDKHATPRKTMIVDENAKTYSTSMVNKTVVVAITNKGYVHCLDETLYQRQKRGGRGSSVIQTSDDDAITHIFSCKTNQTLGLFTKDGKLYRIKASEIPETGRNKRGTLIYNLINVSTTDQIASYTLFNEKEETTNLFFLTKKGYIKKMSAEEIVSSRNGTLSIKLKANDELLKVYAVDEDDVEIIVATRDGQSIRFNTKDVRPMGRVSRGVMGINLSKDDYIVNANLSNSGTHLFVISENGYGKRTPIDEYRVQKRGGKGVYVATFSDKEGKVADAVMINEDQDVLISTTSKKMIRMSVKDIAEMSRSTSGGKILDLCNDHTVGIVTVIDNEEEE